MQTLSEKLGLNRAKEEYEELLLLLEDDSEDDDNYVHYKYNVARKDWNVFIGSTLAVI